MVPLQSVGSRGPVVWIPHIPRAMGRQWHPLCKIHREPQPSHLGPCGQGPGRAPWCFFLSQALCVP